MAHIDYEKCVNCKICVKTCPTKAIQDDRPERPRPVVKPVEAKEADSNSTEAKEKEAQVTENK